ncbi:hypothetical protein SAMN02927924_01948 [Sphingobium faniae]|nr:hypothetical protein SAMN02927924_01948 [Sphingobium faniae]
MSDLTATPDGGQSSSLQMVHIASITMIAILTGIVPVLQPLLLGAMAEAGRLDAGQIGIAAMVEGGAMALAVGLAAAFLPPRHLRLITAGALCVALLANIATAGATGIMIAVARFFNGMACGLTIWIFVGLLTRLSLPARLVAIYSTVQACCALLIAFVMTTFLLPHFGGGAGYVALAMTNLGLLFLVPLMPTRFVAVETDRSPGPPRGLGLVALIGVFIHIAAIIGLWVYALPLARSAGTSVEEAGLAISVAIGFQIAGGFTAAWLAPRLAAPLVVLGCIAASLAGIALMTMGGFIPLIMGLVLISMSWTLAAPFHMPLLMAVDPQRRAAMQMGTGQIIGASAGPALAAITAQLLGIRSLFWVSASLFLVAFLVFMFVSNRSRSAISVG